MLILAKQHPNHQHGFTLVELLIVIVVIAILAAITVVAYNGITQRARNDQVIAGVNVYIKAIHQYYILNTAYPGWINMRSCLGDSYPSNQCWSGANGDLFVNAAVDAQLASVLSTKPVLATSLFSIGINNNVRAGAVWDYNNHRVVYYLQGANQDCSIGGASGITEGGVVTQCHYDFNLS